MPVKLEVVDKLNHGAQTVEMLSDKVNTYRERSDRVPPALVIYIHLSSKLFQCLNFEWLGTLGNTD